MTLQITTIGGKMIEEACWKVKEAGSLSTGDIVRINVPFKDAKLVKHLASVQAQECVLEREEDGQSVTLGFFLEKFSHFLDAGEAKPEIETIAWLKPFNRTVEQVVTYIMERESCDSKFLAAVGARRRAEASEEEEGEG
jgi:hypothetical protein